MYKRKILFGLFAKSPSYPNRGFYKARLEGLEYAILFQFIESTKKLISFHTTVHEQRELILAWGKMWILIDDIQDTVPQAVSEKELKNILLGKKIKKYTHPLLCHLIHSANFVHRHAKKSPRYQKYLKLSQQCFESQKSIQVYKKEKTFLSKTLKASEVKGGAFTLSLVYLLNPINITKNIAKAVFIAGSWGQMIDDFADMTEDRNHGIYTIFSFSKKPNKIITSMAKKYQENIFTFTQSKDFMIPFFHDLMTLAKVSHISGVHSVFSYLNH